MTLLIPYAHLGHWYFQLAFSAPVLIVLGYMARDSLRRRWRERQGSGGMTAESDGSKRPRDRGG